VSPDPRAAVRRPLAIPASGILFEGHFPGRPILPGVCLLDLGLRAIDPGVAAPALTEIHSLRFRRLVGPGERLQVDASGGTAIDKTTRLAVRRDAEIVAQGLVALGSPFSPIAASMGREIRPLPDVPPLDELIPHRAPMRFVEGVEGGSMEEIACSASVPAACALAGAGSAPALAALEMAAQTAAVFEALQRRRGGGNEGALLGYLVGARDVRFARPRIEAGRPHTAFVRLAGLAPPLSTYRFEVGAAGEIVAAGSLSTWLTAKAV
jgi:predicted hotdog family 3-hydroxylacyl-ACP dehydratase